MMIFVLSWLLNKNKMDEYGTESLSVSPSLSDSCISDCLLLPPHYLRMDEVESDSSKDSSPDQRTQRYFSMSKINKVFCTFSSQDFLRARAQVTPQPGKDTEPVPEFLMNLRLSDLFDLPSEYIQMNAEISSALSYGNKECLQKLIAYGTPLRCLKNDRGDSILHLAATWGHLELVKSIVSECPCLVLAPNLMCQLPLHVAARAGHLAVVEALIATVAFLLAKLSIEESERLNPHLLKDINGDTALNLALKGRSLEVALCLVNANQQASFLASKDGISPLYLAVEAGDVSVVRAMLEIDVPKGKKFNLQSHLEGRKYLAHAALKSRSTDTLDVILNEFPSLVDERDEEGRTCLSFGALIGYYEGVCNMLDRSTNGVFVCDDDGSYPIHLAVEKGHLEVVNEICKRCPPSMHLLNKKYQNILHIAATSGKFEIIRKWPKGEHMANEKDIDGNTPLHLATIKWRPRAAHYLAGPKNLLIKNNSGLTALDIAELNLKPHFILRERLTLVALVHGHVQRDGRLMKTMKLTKPSIVTLDRVENKEYINTLTMVAALVATVTFAAGFTLPGGYKTSAPNLGSATLATNPLLILFLILNTVAMQSSIVALVSLLWMQFGDHTPSNASLDMVLTSLCIALMTMAYAFFSGLIIAVGHVAGLRVLISFASVFFLVILSLIIVPHSSLQSPSVHARYGSFFVPLLMVINDEEEAESCQCSTHKPVND